jgi:release factor glutamine methyltransferase
MTIQEALAEGIRLLSSPCDSANIDTPALDASILLAGALEIGKVELILRSNEAIGKKSNNRFRTLIERRRNGECIAYIQGHKEFRGLRFRVNPQVLVPRPDSETIVEAVLEYIDSLENRESLSILDLCTGSGALAISLLTERPYLSVTASDISLAALEIAKHNAKLLFEEELSQSREGTEIAEGNSNNNFASFAPLRLCEKKNGTKLIQSIETTISFIQSNLFENIFGRFNIIVSNPPYIPSGELINLTPEVRREPAIALDGGEDGLALIGKIIAQAPDYLLTGGVLLLEAGPDQMPVIRKLLEAHGFSDARVYRDLAGRDRVISAKYRSV